MTRPVALVTGGSRGIGAETCVMLAEHGYDVAINYARDADAAERVAASCRAAGAQALAVQGDVAEENQVLALFARVDAELGVLSALVNNAGVVAPKSRLDEYSVKRIDRLFAVNVRGSLVCP